MLFLIFAAALLQGSSTPAPDSTGVRNPAFSRDGRLAVSVAGDIWVVSKSGAWQRVTSGPAWDRDPAWTPDGAAIVFSSDRSGKFDLWRVPMRAEQGAEQAPERLTSSSLADAEPAVASRRTHRVRPWAPGGGSSLDSLYLRLRVPPHKGFRGARLGPRLRPTARASRTSRSPPRRENFTCSPWTTGRTAPC